MGDALPVQHDQREDLPGQERDQHEIDAAQPKQDLAEQHRRQSRHQPGQDDAEDRRKLEVQRGQSRDVGAGRHECGVSERDLPDRRDQAEADREDRIEQHQVRQMHDRTGLS